MTDALKLTAGDLVRALTAAVAPAVERAVRRRAEDVAEALRADAGAGIVTRVRARDGGYLVSVEGQGLFAREFGTVDRPGDGAVSRAVAGLKT